MGGRLFDCIGNIDYVGCGSLKEASQFGEAQYGVSTT